MEDTGQRSDPVTSPDGADDGADDEPDVPDVKDGSNVPIGDGAVGEDPPSGDGSEDMSPVVMEGPCGEVCPEGRPICDVEKHMCVECGVDDHCRRSKLGRYCIDQQCVGCSSGADCGSAGAAHCDETVGACVGCRASSDCAEVMNDSMPLPVCNEEQRICVQCSGEDFEACGRDMESGKPLVCDSATSECTNRPAGSAAACETCVSDAHCAAGMKCVREVFEGAALDYVCQWALGEPGAPAGCGDVAARPFTVEKRDVTTIDGSAISVCVLAVASCPALRQSGEAPCSGDNGDDACGVTGLDDGLCRPLGSARSEFTCTTACSNTLDCATGFTCDTSVSVAHCAPD